MDTMGSKVVKMTVFHPTKWQHQTEHEEAVLLATIASCVLKISRISPEEAEIYDFPPNGVNAKHGSVSTRIAEIIWVKRPYFN